MLIRMTAAWTGICCSDPLSVYVLIRAARLTQRLVKEGGSFTINVPHAISRRRSPTGFRPDRRQVPGEPRMHRAARRAARRP